MVLFREAAGHMIQASTACTSMGSAMPNFSIGISSVIPKMELESRTSTRNMGPLESPVPSGESNRQRIGAGDPGVSN